MGDSAFRPRQQQRPTRRSDDSAFDDVLKFTNITRPRMVLQRGNHVVRDVFDLLALALGEPADEVTNEKRNVLGALAQWRQPNGEHV